MDKNWAIQKEKEKQDKINELIKMLEDQGYVNSEDELGRDIIEDIQAGKFHVVEIEVTFYANKDKDSDALFEFKKWICNTFSPKLKQLENFCFNYQRYVDSEPMEFDGDILITDPCYITKCTEEQNDWDVCEYGENMSILGINHSMSRDTLYGDWECTTFNTDTTEELGNFCADSGMVGVFLLNEVLDYNPEFTELLKEHPGLSTVIRNFKGTVQFIIKEFEDGFGVWYELQVTGHGISKETGESINFYTSLAEL